MSTPIIIVWFKRDLRIVDHNPLASAVAKGAVLPLFCWEPSVWSGKDYAKQHQHFVMECLIELESSLQKIGLKLHISNAGIIETLNTIKSQVNIAAIYSHEETGNLATYEVDKSVAKWCESQTIKWLEMPQNGVIRRLKNRNEWSRLWEQRMAVPAQKLPTKALSSPLITMPVSQITSALGTDKNKRQKGGRSNALEVFNSFLDGRAAKFRGGISSPLTAVTTCSRISPYLSYGCLSMREVVQASRDRMTWVKEEPHIFPTGLTAGIIGFESRLHWHCHFMQKLESEPEIEFENMHHVHDEMRDELLADTESQRRLKIWSAGETGWPLVDACMAMLRETGWINFRMRAMLMSTASYLYWLHWRSPGLHLANEFLDYEPGIHWSQSQMQSGTTGINTLRIYNPIKQAQEQDPNGTFVRHWLPALKQVPDTWIFEPYLMPKSLQLKYGCLIDQVYPSPIVDIAKAIRKARLSISAARNKEGAYNEKQTIIKKHASRKNIQRYHKDKKSFENNDKNRSIKKKSNNKNILQKELF